MTEKTKLYIATKYNRQKFHVADESKPQMYFCHYFLCRKRSIIATTYRV